MSTKLFFLLNALLLKYTCLIAQMNYKTSNDNTFVTLASRCGAGVHQYPNVELGLSLININDSGINFGAASAYSTFIIQQNQCNSYPNIYGYKIGAQSSWAIFMWGIEWKSLYFTGKNRNFLSPKFGLSLLDILNIEYAYDLINMHNVFPITSRHQLSLNINLNKRIGRYLKKNWLNNH